MSPSRENLGTWIGLAVGLGLAWAGWEWWTAWQANVLDDHARIDEITGLPEDTSPWFENPSLVRAESFFSFDYLATPWWLQTAIIAGLVIVALLCTAAGTTLGRPGPGPAS